jgi:hypothetical protein
MLAAQFLLVALLAWRLLAPDLGTVAKVETPAQAVADDPRLPSAAASSQEQRARQVEAQLRVLDRVVGALQDSAPENLVQLLEEKERENLRLEADARVYRGLEARVATENEKLMQLLDAAKAERLRLGERIEELQTEVAAQELAEDQYRREIAGLRADLEGAESGEGATSLASRLRDPMSWLWAAGGALVGALLVLGAVVFRSDSPAEPRFDDGDDEEPPQTDEADDKGGAGPTNSGPDG